MLCDLNHHAFGIRVSHLSGVHANFLCALVPKFRVISDGGGHHHSLNDFPPLGHPFPDPFNGLTGMVFQRSPHGRPDKNMQLRRGIADARCRQGGVRYLAHHNRPLLPSAWLPGRSS
jgi:hypothetical protein